MRTAITGLFGALIAAQTAVAMANAEELNLYTTREPKLVEPLLASFTEKTGITVNTIFLKDGMPERVEEGLGLQIVRSLVEQDMRGELRFDSPDAGGCSARISVPQEG